MIACRRLPHETNDGPTNMALDETLLEIAANSPDTVIIRTYEWSEPTLSLGYFQSIADAEADPRWGGRPLVRRLTGGGALWHDHEITYAVAIPATHAFARPSTALYEAIHGAIAAELGRLGINAARRGDVSVLNRPGTDRPFLCFQDRDAADVVVGPVKLVGSAQRRRAGAVLQHGSILLARSLTTPELPGLSDLADRRTARQDRFDSTAEWSCRLQNILTSVLGSSVFEENLSSIERKHADLLRRDIYQNPAWTDRR